MKNELLAPNGKPSNLNATQYELVRTTAFKKWFGDWEKDPANSSKVVDENGEPMVVWHTTSAEFNVFSKKKSKEGFFFSPQKQRLSVYNKSNINSYFLNLRNPSHELFKKDLKYLIPKGYDGIMDYGHAKHLGNKNLYEIIAFEPNQIKLADGTNTEFDSENDDIRFEDGGSIRLAPNGNYSYLSASQYEMVRTPEFKKWFGDWEKAYETGNYDGVSKVIAYNTKGFSGEPLVCSHASYNKFNQFNTPSFFQEGDGSGAYGDSTDEEYTNYDVFLNIKNPLELRGSFLREKFIPLISEIYKNAGISEAEITSRIEFAEEYRDSYGLFKLFEKSSRQGIGYNWDWIFDYCKKNGFDGFVMRDSDQSIQYTITTWVALYPNQIKIADGTNTEFDSENDDIRFEQGGEIDLQIDERDKKLRNDKDYFPFEILNKKGEKLGKIDLIYRSDLGGYQISNSNVFEKGKGIGKKAYLKLRQILGKPIISDSSRTEDAENLWKSLERTNDAKYNSEIGKYSIYEKGGRTIAQTPAPKKDRVHGSDLNKSSSSKDLSSAKLIKFDDKTLDTIKNKVKEHNSEHPNKKINLASAKAVVRRGMGAYSSSHRPTISSGKPNSRVAWGLARLNAFTYKIVNGKSKSGKYKQDDDLIEELGYKVANYKNGGEMKKDIRCINCGWEWNKKDSELWDMYICHKCGFDNTSFYTSDPINRLLKGGVLNSVTSVSPDYLKMFLGK